MARNPSAADATAAWSQGVQNGAAKLERGVNRVTEAPTMAAARQLPAMRQNFLKAMDSGYTLQQLQKTSLADWKGPMLGKGKANYQSAATTGKTAYQNYAGRAAPAWAAMSQAAEQIDKTTIDGKLARVRVAVEGNMALKGQ